jgi:gluconate 2-dehydrogenase gamma chain
MGGNTGMNISRRAFATGLAGVPLLNGQTQSGKPLTLPAAAESPGASEWHARVFDDHQLETVAILVDLIIPKTDTPGARDALVQQHLDNILSESPEPVRTTFLEGLWWLDGYCLKSAAKPFKDLSSDDQMAALLHLYGSSDPDLQPGTQFVRLARTWTAKIYYSTQTGEQELNKGGHVPSQYSSDCSV